MEISESHMVSTQQQLEAAKQLYTTLLTQENAGGGDRFVDTNIHAKLHTAFHTIKVNNDMLMII